MYMVEARVFPLASFSGLIRRNLICLGVQQRINEAAGPFGFHPARIRDSQANYLVSFTWATNSFCPR